MRVRCIARKLAPRHKKAAPALGLFLFGGDHFSSRLMRGNLMSPDASESSSLFWRPPRRLSNSLSDERCLSSLSSRLVTGGDLDMASGGAPPAGNAEADVGVAAAAGSFADGLLSSMSSSGGRRRDLVVTVGSELTSEPAVAYTVARDVALSAVRRRAARAPTPSHLGQPQAPEHPVRRPGTRRSRTLSTMVGGAPPLRALGTPSRDSIPPTRSARGRSPSSRRRRTTCGSACSLRSPSKAARRISSSNCSGATSPRRRWKMSRACMAARWRCD